MIVKLIELACVFNQQHSLEANGTGHKQKKTIPKQLIPLIFFNDNLSFMSDMSLLFVLASPCLMVPLMSRWWLFWVDMALFRFSIFADW